MSSIQVNWRDFQWIWFEYSANRSIPSQATSEKPTYKSWIVSNYSPVDKIKKISWSSLGNISFRILTLPCTKKRLRKKFKRKKTRQIMFYNSESWGFLRSWLPSLIKIIREELLICIECLNIKKIGNNIKITVQGLFLFLRLVCNLSFRVSILTSNF